jgi:hypothetical protein
MNDQPSPNRRQELHARLRQLILMRETGPKRAAWHAARASLIWRLHDELRQAGELEAPTNNPEATTPPSPPLDPHR